MAAQVCGSERHSGCSTSAELSELVILHISSIPSCLITEVPGLVDCELDIWRSYYCFGVSFFPKQQLCDFREYTVAIV
jgi:hypothetical protein